MTKRTTTTLLLFLMVSAACMGQLVEPVHWRVAATAAEGDTAVVRLEATVDEGWHLYGTDLPDGGPKPTQFAVKGIDVFSLHLAEGRLQTTYDENFMMDLFFFAGKAVWELRLPLPAAAGGAIEGTVEYMACNDMMCLPPTTWEWTASLPSPSSASSSTSLWWLFLMGLLGGLLAIFTPCVWPVIPMTVSFFMKRSANGRAVKEALLYGLSIIVIYVGLGLLVTLLFGASALNDIATNAVVNILFFLLLVVFALSFFGAFELTLPASWSTRLDEKARSTSGVLSILLMAFTLVIVSFSCTGPIIGTLLVEAAGKSLLAPAVGMLGFAVALALPFSLFAMFPQWMQRLPRSGGWMDSFKVVLAFLELALSLKFFSVADLAYGWHLLDREVFVALWVVIFALLGFYLLGLFRFRHEEKTEGIGVLRFLLAVVSLSFAVYLLPGLWGAPLKAVSAFAPPISTQDWVMGRPQADVSPQPASIDEALQQAGQTGRRVLLDFSGYGCVNCRKMEAKVLSDPRVAERLQQQYVVVTLIVDDKTRLPEPLVVSENGKQKQLRTVGDRNSWIQRSTYGANAQPYYVKLQSDGRQTGQAYSYDEDIDKFLNWLNE
ncbi:MAG: thioredoxin family protein [Paludibacteraceae bacterium]|nr:thioredoxin family protein [Paludibacteraceae bacterium]